jgi:hypothetical protein
MTGRNFTRIFVYGLSVLLLLPGLAGADGTIVFREGFNGYAGTHDNQLDNDPCCGGGGDTNYGGIDEVNLRNWPTHQQHYVLKFTNLDVLAGTTVDQARIDLRSPQVVGSGSFDVEIFQIADENADWIEGDGVTFGAAAAGTSTFNNRIHPSTAWTGAPGAIGDPNIGGAAIFLDSFTVSPLQDNDTIYSINLPNALVQQWIDGGVNAGLVLVPEFDAGAFQRLKFRVSESGPPGWERRPELIVDFIGDIPEPEPEPIIYPNAREYEPDEYTVALYHFDEYSQVASEPNVVVFEEAQGRPEFQLESGFGAGAVGTVNVGLPGAIHGAVGNQKLTSGDGCRLVTGGSEMEFLNLPSWTLEFWWKPTADPLIQTLVAREGCCGGLRTWRVYGKAGNQETIQFVFWEDGAGDGQVLTPLNLAPDTNKWYHVAITYDEPDPNTLPTVQIYVTPGGDTTANLVVTEQLPFQIAQSTAPDTRLTILHNLNFQPNERYTSSIIDELRFSSKVRSPAEFTTLLPPDPDPAYRDVGSLSAKIRRIVEDAWNARKQDISDYIDYSFGVNDSAVVLHDLEFWTISLLRYAACSKNYAIVDDLAGLYLQAHTYYGAGRWETSEKGGDEDTLWSAQYGFNMTVAINAILDIPPGDRTTNMNNFLTTYVPVMLTDHLDRWINGPAEFNTNWPGSCDLPGGLITHKARLTALLNQSYPNNFSYCNAVIDTDMWMIACAAELLVANDKDPVAVPMDVPFKAGVVDYVDVGTDLLESRLTTSDLTDFDRRSPVAGLNFDLGKWTDHPDYQFAGYEGETAPVAPGDVSKVANVGWDVSHANRFSHVFNSLHTALGVTGQTFPDPNTLLGLSNQLMLGAFTKNLHKPQFTNYMDGTNGWYRAPRFGPFGISRNLFEHQYGDWSTFNGRVSAVMNVLWQMLDSMTYVTDASGSGPDAINNGAIWQSGAPTGGYLLFDGLDDHLIMVDTGLWDAPQGSLELWVKTTEPSTQSLIEIVTGFPNHLNLRVLDNIRITSEINNVVAFDRTSSISVADGNWHHVVVTQDGAAVKIYIDGAEDVAASGPQGTTWTSHLGSTDPTTGWSFSGELTVADGIWDVPYIGCIDEVRVYNRALSSVEVAEHFAGTFNNNTDLVLYLPMEEDTNVDAVTALQARHLDEDYGRATLYHRDHSTRMFQFLPSLAQAILLNAEAANLDGLGPVDYVDYSLLAQDYPEQGKSLWGDINGDNVVNLDDVSVFSEFWLGQ